MKRLLSLALLALLTLGATAQDDQDVQTIREFRRTLDASFADSVHSPLLPADRAAFRGLDYFPIDLNYRVWARFEATPNDPVFEMETTTERRPKYRRYGIAHFELDGQSFQLSIFQNIDLVKKEGYADYLFLPYTDQTSGGESYGGGKYLDLRTPKDDGLWLDFNLAYNPYCAYNPRYSCPVPPDENYMDIEIRAGVKAFGKH